MNYTFHSLGILLWITVCPTLSYGYEKESDFFRVSSNARYYLWEVHDTLSFSDIWIDSSGTTGWAAQNSFKANNNGIYRYSNGLWSKIELKSKNVSPQVREIWFNKEGTIGWAIGKDVWHYNNGTWQFDSVATALLEKSLGEEFIIWSLEMSHDAKNGWMFGFDYRYKENKWCIFKYSNYQWKVDAAFQDWNSRFHDVWVDKLAMSGWAVGDGIYSLSAAGKWVKVHFDNMSGWFAGIDCDLNNNMKIAVGNDGMIFTNQSGTWVKDTIGSSLAGANNLHGVEYLGEVDISYVIGDNGTLLVHDEKWYIDSLFWKSFREYNFISIAVNSNGNNGFISGSKNFSSNSKSPVGLLLKRNEYVINPKIVSASQLHNLTNLTDSVVLQFANPIYNVDIGLYSEDNSNYDYLVEGRDYKVVSNLNKRTAVIYFTDRAENILSAYSGQKAVYKITFRTNPGSELWSTLESKAFFISGPAPSRIWLKRAIILAISILLINLFLVLISAKSRWLRKRLFKQEVQNVLGILKLYPQISQLYVIFFPKLFNLLLNDYKKNIVKLQQFNKWDDYNYFEPKLKSKDEIIGYDTLQSLLYSKDNIETTIWAITGRSGIGKTALLEQLGKGEIDKGNPIFFINLGEHTAYLELIKDSIRQYGDLDLSLQTLNSLLRNGCFTIFLDGLNEVNDSQIVRNFIYKYCKSNKIVLSTQYLPDWNEFSIKEIKIQPFHYNELSLYLRNEKVSQEIHRRNNLFDNSNSKLVIEQKEAAYFLPITASLIKLFYNRFQKVPTNRAELYDATINRLKESTEYLNFSRVTWKMFRYNLKYYSSNQLDGVSKKFITDAVNYGILFYQFNENENNFSFRHERISRYIVANYLMENYDNVIPENIHSLLEFDYPRTYWLDVFDFYGELLLREISKEKRNITDYKDFLINVGLFEPQILKERLVDQLHSLYRKNIIEIDPDFEMEISSLLILE